MRSACNEEYLVRSDEMDIKNAVGSCSSVTG